MKGIQTIKGGVYLVVDPAMERSLLLCKLAAALKAGLVAVQLWNNWLPETNKQEYIAVVSDVCRAHKVPLIIDNEWELMLNSPFLDGVHFAAIPDNYDLIKQQINRPFLAGITCSGDLKTVKWADSNKIHYVSFCAMFASPSAGSCDIVMPSTVRQARQLTSMPLFVSGGITPDNICSLREQTPFDGVAIISGVMSADNPFEKVLRYQNALK
ncbi:thiamine phosphate synthase [Mucilaginibacter sp. UR6-1]|uniref:thiamine phosphate synthase n=1 Tax=Mucilaginibacter sp. UR6-1 TaxID=1435643 RepID=UPI001E436B17|nr:thiamine phosphate synthase [Mucilaginibacter sp. UR6-1]MCC8408219.1 thiamine phosphate synthase [Mucilaginibacter sp. UR6-1]